MRRLLGKTLHQKSVFCNKFTGCFNGYIANALIIGKGREMKAPECNLDFKRVFKPTGILYMSFLK